MKIQILSDLHLEMCDYTATTTDADVIILPGDIGPPQKVITLIAGLMSRSPAAHVIYVAGNHEFYGRDINAFRKELRQFCGPATGRVHEDIVSKFHFLDNDKVIIDGVRFLGTTLWTDFELYGLEQKKNCMDLAERCLNDFRLIKNRQWEFTPQDSINLHVESVKWLELKLKHEPFEGSTVVVTHHAPSYQSVVARYRDDLLSACFASNLDHLLGFSELWLHGHMHDSLDYTVNETRVICNPRGYSRYEKSCENGNFKSGLVIEVGKQVLDEAESTQANNQAVIDALNDLKEQYSAEYSLSYYDLSQLPPELEAAYWENRSGSTQPDIHGGSPVYTWDWEEWRDIKLFRLGAHRKGQKNEY